jgi:hypothetical protein
MDGDYVLARGPHATPEDGRCAMEWVSHLAGEPHSDQPACVSPVLRAVCVALNDGLEKGARQRLRPYLARTIGTVDDGFDDARSWMALDWLIREYTPAWLRLADVSDEAERLASLAALQDVRTLAAALGPLTRARRDARDALTAALRGSRMAWAFPSAAERSARVVAGASGEGAVWAVARGAVGGSAGERACAAARGAADDAAATAARTASRDVGRAAAKAAARAALAPTLDALQISALALLERMLPTETLAPVLSAADLPVQQPNRRARERVWAAPHPPPQMGNVPGAV